MILIKGETAKAEQIAEKTSIPYNFILLFLFEEDEDEVNDAML